MRSPVTSAHSSVRSPATAPIISRAGPVVCFSGSARCRPRPVTPPPKMTAAMISANLSGLINPLRNQKALRITATGSRAQLKATRVCRGRTPIREIARQAVSNFKVFDHRIGYRSFGNDPDDVARPRPPRAVKDDRGARAMSLEPGQLEAQEVGVPADRRRVFDKAVDQRVGIDPGFAPQPRARRHETDEAAITLDDDGAQIVAGVVAERVLERRAGFDEVEAALHHVLRLLHEIEIVMAFLGDA